MISVSVCRFKRYRRKNDDAVSEGLSAGSSKVAFHRLTDVEHIAIMALKLEIQFNLSPVEFGILFHRVALLVFFSRRLIAASLG